MQYAITELYAVIAILFFTFLYLGVRKDGDATFADYAAITVCSAFWFVTLIVYLYVLFRLTRK